MRAASHPVRRNARGEPTVDQGTVHGFPVTYNPDTNRYCVHAIGATDGTGVLKDFSDLRNAVQFARRLARARQPKTP